MQTVGWLKKAFQFQRVFCPSWIPSMSRMDSVNLRIFPNPVPNRLLQANPVSPCSNEMSEAEKQRQKAARRASSQNKASFN